MQFSACFMILIIVLLIILLISFKDNKKEKFIRTRHRSGKNREPLNERTNVNDLLCHDTEHIGHYNAQCDKPCTKLSDSNENTCIRYVDPENPPNKCVWISKNKNKKNWWQHVKDWSNQTIPNVLDLQKNMCVSNSKAKELKQKVKKLITKWMVDGIASAMP